MAGSTIQSNIQIDITAGARLTGDAKAEFDQLRQSLLNTNITAKETQDTLLRMKAILDSNTGSINSFTNATNQIKSGLEGAANSTKLYNESTGELKNSLTSAFSGLNTAYGIIRKIAYALPGIGIAGIFALIGEGIVKLISALTDLNTVQNAMDKVNATVIKHLSDEVGQVQVLTATIQDHNTTKADQKKAIQQLIDQHPNYFGNLKDQSNLTEKLTEDTQKFTKAIEEEARIKAVSAEITKLVGKQLEVEIEAKENLDYWNQRILLDTQDQNRNAVELDNQSLVLSTKSSQKKIDDIQKQIEVYKTLGVVSEQTLSQLGGTTGKGDTKKPQNDNSLKEQALYIEESKKILEDAEEKEITNENIKYEKIKGDLEKFHHSTEELTEQHHSNIADIRQKYADIQQKAIDKIEADINRKQTEANEKGEAKLSEQMQNHYAKQAEVGKSGLEKKIDEENIFYSKSLEAFMLYGGYTENLEKQHQDALAAIKKEYSDKEEANAEKKRATELTRGQRQVYSIIGQQNSSFAYQKMELDKYEQAVRIAYTKAEITTQQYNDDIENIADARNTIRIKEIDSYASYAGDIGNSLSTIGQAFGENTQLGKDMAIAGGVISTISGAIKAYDSLASIPYVGPALGIAAAAAALASGYANVQKIQAVQITGQGGSSNSAANTSGGAVSSYSAPNIPTAISGTRLAPQSINQIAGINANNDPQRFFVLEADITNSQQNVRGYVNASTIH